MAQPSNRADLLLLDTGSIMVLAFGALTILLASIILVGSILHEYSALILAAAAVSGLLTLNGLGLIVLSTHTTNP